MLPAGTSEIVDATVSYSVTPEGGSGTEMATYANPVVIVVNSPAAPMTPTTPATPAGTVWLGAAPDNVYTAPNGQGAVQINGIGDHDTISFIGIGYAQAQVSGAAGSG